MSAKTNQKERNDNIYHRFFEGEKIWVLADEFGLSKSRIHYIIKTVGTQNSATCMLSQRAKTGLEGMGIKSIKEYSSTTMVLYHPDPNEIAEMTCRELRLIPSVGRTTITEILEWMGAPYPDEIFSLDNRSAQHIKVKDLIARQKETAENE